MNIVILSVLLFVMFIDVFVVLIIKGSILKSLCVLSVIKLGLIFGCIEVIVFVIGWLIGSVGVEYVEVYDYWIVFVLLVGLGVYMLFESCKEDDDEDDILIVINKCLLMVILFIVVGISIDVMIVGISFVFMKVNIYLVVVMIGFVIMIMVIIGLLFGNVISGWVGKKVEVIGGIVLVLIGCGILYSYIMV